MKKFDSYEELLQEIGVTFSSQIKHCYNKLNSFLECEGSDVVDNEGIEPSTSFEIRIDGFYYEIGVTAVNCDQEEEFKYYYWFINHDEFE